eukprot:scaffold51449_cov35-Cyclotella_meneghiniana.AAC.3
MKGKAARIRHSRGSRSIKSFRVRALLLYLLLPTALMGRSPLLGRCYGNLARSHPGPWRLTSKGDEGEGGSDPALLRE